MATQFFNLWVLVPRWCLKKLPCHTSLFKVLGRIGVYHDFSRRNYYSFSFFPQGIVILGSSCTAYNSLNTQKKIKKYGQNWKSYQGYDNRRETTSVEVFLVHPGLSRHTSNFGGTSNIHKFFFPQYFLRFSSTGVDDITI